MFTQIAVVAAGGMTIGGMALVAAQPQDQSAGTTTASGSPATLSSGERMDITKKNTNDDGTLKVVVHTDQHVADDRDSRVSVGEEVTVSMPDRVIVVHGRHGKETVVIVGAAGADGAIAIPENTLGPGEPLWAMSDRVAASVKLMQADADLAKIDAERARPRYDDFTCPRDIYAENASFGRFGYGGIAPVGGFGGFGSVIGGFGGFGGFEGGRFHDGLRGPVVTTVTHSDLLGSKAQNAFIDAAYPRLNGSQDAHDRAIREFGRAATPPIVRIQNDVDRAHNNASTEQPQIDKEVKVKPARTR